MRNTPETPMENQKPYVLNPEIKEFINKNWHDFVNKMGEIEKESRFKISNISQKTRAKFQGIEIHTGNDNHINFKEKAFSQADDGHTFDIGGKINFSYNDRPFELTGSLDSYTNSPIFISKDGEQFWENYNPINEKTTNERVDRASINLNTQDTVFNNGSTIVTAKYGAGISYTGNMGGEKIQNAWHKTGAADYYVYAPYEEKQGFGANINLGIDARQKLNEYIYTGARANTTIRLAGQGNTNSEIVGYAGVKTKYAELEWWMGKVLMNNDTSPTIALSQSQAKDTFGYVRAWVGTENLKLFYDVTTKNHGRGTVGISFTKKF